MSAPSMRRRRACERATRLSCWNTGGRAASAPPIDSPGSPAPSSGIWHRGRDQLDGLVVWVARRLAYVSGSSGPLDTAVETLLAGQGVCRDYAHLVIAMARALDMPARCASVYAPGLWPMDFHAVAEVFVEGRWNAVDATYLAPRQSLVRIATGRDAADTAFLTTIEGDVELLEVDVRASVDGELPLDSFTEPMFLR